MDREDSRVGLRTLAGVALLGVLFYLPSLGGQFLNWDDGWLVVDNPYLGKASDLPRLLDPAAARRALGAEYLPVRDLSLWVDRRLWDLDPAGYHLHNALLYGLVCALVLLALRRLTGAARAAAAGAVLFAVHPVHVESVAWISERKGLYAAAFLLASLLAWWRWTRGSGARWLAISVALFVLAALSKSTVHFAALLLPALAWLEARREGRRLQTGRTLLAALPFAAVSVVAVALNARHQAAVDADYGWAGTSAAGAALVIATGAARYVGMLLFPVGLSAEYQVIPGPAGWAALAFLLLLAGATAAAVLRRSPAASCAAFAWLAWLPVSNLVPLPNRMADRYVFIASIGAAGLAGLAVEAVWRRVGPHRALAGLVVVAVSLGALSVRRMAVWHDPLSLWEDAVAEAPGSGRAYQNLGEALLRAGRVDEAWACWFRMVEVEPDQSSWWLYVEQRLVEAGREQRAEALLRQGLLRLPGDPGIRVNLAGLLVQRSARSGGDRAAEEEAGELLHEVAGRWQSGRRMRATALVMLGALRFAQGRMEEGLLATRDALELGPEPGDELRALMNLQQAYRQLGREEDELRMLRRLLPACRPLLPEADVHRYEERLRELGAR